MKGIFRPMIYEDNRHENSFRDEFPGYWREQKRVKNIPIDSVHIIISKNDEYSLRQAVLTEAMFRNHMARKRLQSTWTSRRRQYRWSSPETSTQWRTPWRCTTQYPHDSVWQIHGWILEGSCLTWGVGLASSARKLMQRKAGGGFQILQRGSDDCTLHPKMQSKLRHVPT